MRELLARVDARELIEWALWWDMEHTIPEPTQTEQEQRAMVESLARAIQGKQKRRALSG